MAQVETVYLIEFYHDNKWNRSFVRYGTREEALKNAKESAKFYKMARVLKCESVIDIVEFVGKNKQVDVVPSC